MRTIYIDSDYICHADYVYGRTAVETDALNEVLDVALPCYRFVPAHDEKVELIQCIDSERERIIKEVHAEAYVDGRDKVIDAIGEIVDGSTNFTANNNYDLGSLLMIDGEAYETIKAIPRGKTIHINEDVVKTTITKYMEEKE